MAYSNADDFCYNKLLLEPREATFFDLIRLLFSSNIKNRRFIESSEEHIRHTLYFRWIVFISVLAQKFLLIIRKPLAIFGRTIEMFLNYLSSNGGFFGLLLNIIKGKVVKPDKESATYTSIVGYFDVRVDLGSKITPGNQKYNAFLSLMAAKVSYENEAFIRSVVTNNWNMEYFKYHNFWNDHLDAATTQACLFQGTTSNSNLVVVAFRGTTPYSAYDWISDVDLSWYEIPGVGRIHRGFLKALGQQKSGWPTDIKQDDKKLYAYYAIKKKLKQIVQNNSNAKILVTGHSLGGALAILFVGMLAIHEESSLLEKLEGVYTFGQPRVGDAQFGEYMESKLASYKVKYFRTVYCNDVVPRLPFDNKSFLFKHFGGCQYYNSFYKNKILDEEPNKNYFSLLQVIPMFLNAIWELIRSFLIPIVRGREYKETWLLIMTRLIMVIIPGVPAHLPQDYGNSTRLG